MPTVVTMMGGAWAPETAAARAERFARAEAAAKFATGAAEAGHIAADLAAKKKGPR